VRICGDLLIERPIDEVFTFATDERNEPSYHKAMVRAVKTTPGPVGRCSLAVFSGWQHPCSPSWDGARSCAPGWR
jgi:hypothetical protein